MSCTEKSIVKTCWLLCKDYSFAISSGIFRSIQQYFFSPFGPLDIPERAPSLNLLPKIFNSYLGVCGGFLQGSFPKHAQGTHIYNFVPGRGWLQLKVLTY